VGKSQNRFGVESNGESLDGVNAELTIAERLKKVGYATGQIGILALRRKFRATVLMMSTPRTRIVRVGQTSISMERPFRAVRRSRNCITSTPAVKRRWRSSGAIRTNRFFSISLIARRTFRSTRRRSI
jgi:hypothetical protein